MSGLLVAERKFSRAAQAVALGVAISSSVCSYFLPKHVTVIPPHFWAMVGVFLSIVLCSLLIHEKQSLAKQQPSLEPPECAWAWWLVVWLTPLLLHGLLYAIALFHFPVFIEHITTPSRQAAQAVTCYWLLITVCVGLVRFFQTKYPQYFLYAACVTPLVQGTWRARIVEYGLYLILMSQIIFYALCLSSVFLFVLRILQQTEIAVFSLDAWYFSVLILGFVTLIIRKLSWRKILRSSIHRHWSINHWLVVAGVSVIALLGAPLALSDWLITKGLYTHTHHYHLTNTLFTLRENIGMTEVRGWYLSGSLWILALPWVMSIYCRFAGQRSFGWIAVTLCAPALLLEHLGFSRLTVGFSEMYSIKVACLTCLFLLIYIKFTFSKQTNNHRLVGGWLPRYPNSRTIKLRSCSEGLGRLLRISLIVGLLSAASLWPLVQLQVSLYAFGVLLVWCFIILSYAKHRIFSVVEVILSKGMMYVAAKRA